MTFVELQEKINKNKQVDFGEVFGDAFDLFKKVWLQGFLKQLILFGIIMGIMFILYIPLMVGVFIFDGAGLDSGNGIVPILIFVVMILVYFFLIVAMIFISIGLQAAFYRQMRMSDRGLTREAGVSWGVFFKKEYFNKLFLISLGTLGIAIVSYLLCVLPIIYAIIPLQYVSLVFAFNPELSIKELFTVCFNIGTKKWLITFVLMIVCSFLAQFAGFFLCGIGILFTASFVYLPPYLIYKEVVGFYEDDEAIAKIGV